MPIKHIMGERCAVIVHDKPDDGRVFTAPSGYPESEFSWRVRYVKLNTADRVCAASIIETFQYLLEADRKEADKQLGHLRSCYRASKKWSPSVATVEGGEDHG